MKTFYPTHWVRKRDLMSIFDRLPLTFWADGFVKHERFRPDRFHDYIHERFRPFRERLCKWSSKLEVFEP